MKYFILISVTLLNIFLAIYGAEKSPYYTLGNAFSAGFTFAIVLIILRKY